MNQDEDKTLIPVLYVINWGHQSGFHFKMDKGYSPFDKEEEEILVTDNKEMWITDMKDETHQVFGDEVQVLTVYFNAYPPTGHQYGRG